MEKGKWVEEWVMRSKPMLTNLTLWWTLRDLRAKKETGCHHSICFLYLPLLSCLYDIDAQRHQSISPCNVNSLFCSPRPTRAWKHTLLTTPKGMGALSFLKEVPDGTLTHTGGGGGGYMVVAQATSRLLWWRIKVTYLQFVQNFLLNLEIPFLS